MDIILNGETHAARDGATLQELVESLGLEGSRLAVELDGVIIRRPHWAETVLSPGAKVEIVHFVGGG